MKKLFLGLVLSLFLVSIAFGQPIFDYTDRFSFNVSSTLTVVDCSGNTIPMPLNFLWEVMLTKEGTGEVFIFNFPLTIGQVVIMSPAAGTYLGKIRVVGEKCCDGTQPCNGAWGDFYGRVRFSQ